MKITLLGHGKMGHAVERVANDRGHEILATLSEGWRDDEVPKETDLVIEFTRPSDAEDNISRILMMGYPVVSGTTGWPEDGGMDRIQALTTAQNGTFFYASNFSIGVYLFRKMVRELSRLMNRFPDFSDVSMEEVHHIHKLDYPSGTALTIAKEDVLSQLDRKDKIASYLAPGDEPDLGEDRAKTLLIKSIREGEIAGVHTVEFLSPGVEAIRIEHESLGREGLAKGAVLAAEFAIGKKGVFGMDDLMKRYFEE